MPGGLVKTSKNIMNEVFKLIFKSICDMVSNTYAAISGVIMAIVGYLYPVFDISAFLLLLFSLDVLFGAWKAKKIKKEEFSMKIVWVTTFPRMLLAFLLIICTFIWDKIAEQTLIDTSNTVGLLFAGALIWSIAENGYHITKWFVFRVAAVKFGNMIKDKTGIDIAEESKKSDDETN